jgi:hypothetical protein
MLAVARDGEEWLRFRRVMNRVMLRSDSSHAVLKPVEPVATELVARWKTKYSGRELPNLERQLYRWSIDGEFLIMRKFLDSKSVWYTGSNES